MSERSHTPDPAATPRQEKLQAIAAVFGEAVAARLAGPRPDAPLAPQATDPDRLAWQTNRLIRHLRDRVELGSPAPEARSPGPKPPASRRPGQLPALVPGEDLAAEHPAVIAHILRTEPQQVRVAVLRALPGTVARAVMQRLRTS
jgi:hypothetical protein